MGHARDFTKGELVIGQVLEDHDNDRHVDRIRPEREPMSVGPDACERCLGVGDREHLSRRIERDDGIRGVEEKREATRTRSEIEGAFPRSESYLIYESAQPDSADRLI